MKSTEDKPILLFDGVCHLCAGSVQFVIKRDPLQRFRFAPLQSAAAQQLLAKYDASGNNLDSVVLIYKGRMHRKSRAALHTLLLLHRAWRRDSLDLPDRASGQFRPAVRYRLVRRTSTENAGRHAI